MSRERKFGEDTPFGKWVRHHPKLTTDPPHRHELSVQNLDYVWHWYGTDDLMLIEEKMYGGMVSFAQADTHSVLSQMIAYGDGQPVRNKRGQLRSIRWRGYHVLQFEHTDPTDGRIRLDGRYITEEQLLAFLRFEAPDDWYFIPEYEAA